MINKLRRMLRKMDFDVIRYSKSADYRLIKLLKKYAIDLVIDCGANIGQYGLCLRQSGYKHQIVSFEPLTDAYQELSDCAIRDLKWQTYNYALGNYNGYTAINRSINSESSSLLPMLPRHSKADPKSIYQGTEQVIIHTLDSVFNEIKGTAQKMFLKIDSQGYESQILAGASQSLNEVTGIQLELSYVPLYKGQKLQEKLVSEIVGLGFSLVDINPIFHDPDNGQLLQADGTFFRLK
ncbi:MAG: FkbM family methyltransferase [Candidatus Marinimicrobia bacterium]|nr:FkbM family methyltransferase [Candidatus Neomarinimicrobiota bacterium]